ncbi:calcium-binding protein [Mesorhizobium sp. YR577]|jgi:serralysin|uniref:calcium-binding protein n=1 Tax=Mesorhizobium sp. YR577 TaxID=1884373 RepID=UPI0008E91065|nr:calcium-binding protein [Mesorhizobium sp. YR577]SFT49301.1 Ca2+-binding protein, RTX toxin-related [Mesorhizobium sp. YR577]
MATLTVSFPGGIYPLGLDYNPSIGELVNLNNATVVSSSATQRVLQMENGLKLKLIGTGFTYDAKGYVTGGTLASVQLLQSNGTTVLQTLAGINRPFTDVSDAADTFSGWDLNAWLMSGNDTINGSSGADDLYGHAGNDTLNGGDGDDFLVGGAGKDTYNGGNGYDQISFAEYEPTALRGVNINAVTRIAIDQWGNSESFTSIESFRGSQFADVMLGSAANEQFMGMNGRDRIDGGAGIDEVRYHRDANWGGNAGVNVNLTTGVAIDGFGKQDTLLNIENVRGTASNDVLVGSAVSNVLRGEAGNDSLNGMAGADTMKGGTGNDTYYVDNAGDIVDELSDGGSGTDTVVSAISFNLANTTQVKGTVENLNLSGTGAISGTGNAGNNTINGNGGNNALNGAAGNDLINGGLGNDTLTGGAGNDTFFFNTALNASTNKDTITDFNVVADTIRLENAIFTGLAAGTLTAAAFHTGSAAADASDRIIYNKTTGALLFDKDGLGGAAAVQFATVSANLTLTNADFFIV